MISTRPIALALLASAACFVDGGIGPETATGSTGSSTSSTSSTASTASTASTSSTSSTSSADTGLESTASPTSEATSGCEVKTWYHDGDGDGHGDPSAAQDACEAPADAVALGDDCDDAHAAAYPGGVELCDKLDNNCDGVVDEYGPTNLELCDGCRRVVTTLRIFDICDDLRAWDPARVLCQARKGDLIAFEELGEFEEFLALLPTPTPSRWIGLSDGVNEGDFLWVSGVGLNDPHWSVDQPDNSGDGENCVELMTSLEWNDDNCSGTHGYICELPH